jgi:CBS domain-containing protein
MKVRECMKPRVISVQSDASVGTAVALFREHHIGTLPVVDAGGHLVGIVRLRALLALIMPDFTKLVSHFEFVHDFGAIEFRSPNLEQLSQPVSDIMNEPICASADSGLVRAAALLNHNNLKDLPIVDENNILVGLASHVDIGIALISHWDLTPLQKNQ